MIEVYIRLKTHVQLYIRLGSVQTFGPRVFSADLFRNLSLQIFLDDRVLLRMWSFIVLLMTSFCMITAIPLPQSTPNEYSNPGTDSFGIPAPENVGTDPLGQTNTPSFSPTTDLTTDLKPAGNLLLSSASGLTTAWGSTSPGSDPLGSAPLGSAPLDSASPNPSPLSPSIASAPAKYVLICRSSTPN